MQQAVTSSDVGTCSMGTRAYFNDHLRYALWELQDVFWEGVLRTPWIAAAVLFVAIGRSWIWGLPLTWVLRQMLHKYLPLALAGGVTLLFLFLCSRVLEAFLYIRYIRRRGRPSVENQGTRHKWWRVKTYIVAAVFAAIAVGVTYFAEHKDTLGGLKKWLEDKKPHASDIGDGRLAAGALRRIGCGTEGTCDLCPTDFDRVIKVECGSVDFESEKDNSFWLGVFSFPVATFYALKESWSGGWRTFAPARAYLLLGYGIVVRLFLRRADEGEVAGSFSVLFYYLLGFFLAASTELIFRAACILAFLVCGRAVAIIASMAAYICFAALILGLYEKFKLFSDLCEWFEGFQRTKRR